VEEMEETINMVPERNLILFQFRDNNLLRVNEEAGLMNSVR
jgi:hypothetical protein